MLMLYKLSELMTLQLCKCQSYLITLKANWDSKKLEIVDNPDDAILLARSYREIMNKQNISSSN